MVYQNPRKKLNPMLHMPNAQGVGLEEALLLTFTQSTPALVGLAHSHCAFKTAVDLLKPVAGVIGLIACPRGGSKEVVPLV